MHLKSDPTTELAYAGDLLPRDPETLFATRNTAFIICGDMNLTKCKLPSRQTAPVLGPNEGRWAFALRPPFDDHVTNLGQAYLSEGGENQCYDNFIVPAVFERAWSARVLEPPAGFIDQLSRAMQEYEVR